MIQKDFDIEAMDRKIDKNLKCGFTIKQILSILKKELQDNLKVISVKHARNVELSDQIEYIETNHFK